MNAAPAEGRAPQRAPRRALGLGLFLAAAWLLLAVPLLFDFGPSWDFVLGEYPHGEQYVEFLATSDARYLDFADGPRPEPRQPHLHYPRPNFGWAGIHPLGATLSGLCCKLLWTTTGLLSSVQAHHLPAPLSVAGLIVLLCLWLGRRLGLLAALAAVLALLLSPPFFTHALSNVRDVPEAVLFATAVLAFLRAVRTGGRGAWLLAGACTGLALAQKANAYFIPVLGLLWWLLAASARRVRGQPALAVPWRGVLLALPAFLLVYLAVSPMLWSDPFARFSEHFGFFWTFGFHGAAADPLDGLKAFLWSTPPALLGLALLGLFERRLPGEERLLLALGVLLPVGRTMLPNAVNYDGVRHFLEFQPFLALLAGAGVARALTWAGALRGRAAVTPREPQAPREPQPLSGLAAVALVALLFATPAAAVVQTYPHGVCYFNSFIGGLSGAQAAARTDPEVEVPCDFWGQSYWQGIAWLNEHAEPGAAVHVAVASHIVRSAAPVALRPDLVLGLPEPVPGAPPPSETLPRVLYVMYVHREVFYDDVARWLEARPDPPGDLALEIVVQDATILVIHRLSSPAEIGRLFEVRVQELAITPTAARIGQWVRTRPVGEWKQVRQLIQQSTQIGRAEAEAQLRKLLPPALHGDAATMLDYVAERDAR
ncbi:MAG: glycosyltransferase family 39 protein [Planctomycetota bacterium]